MQVIQLVVGGLGATNCYFIFNEETKELLIVDPGANGNEIATHANELGAKPVAILLTHGHADHTGAIPDLLELFGDDLPICALDAEQELLETPEMNMSMFMGLGALRYPADRYFTDGEEVTLANLKFRVIATPGHTPGGCCYYFEKEGILFSGDTLFCCSVGRTDFKGGSMEDLMTSIKEKLFVLPDDTAVLPGHDRETTIANEKQNNPFVS